MVFGTGGTPKFRYCAGCRAILECYNNVCTRCNQDIDKTWSETASTSD